ncbi:MAG: RNA polymerase sigma factor [Bacteroidota bacterium]
MFPIDVVEQCKSNDRKAQIQLYEKYCQGMFQVAMRLLQNADDAEDVVQESFIKAFQKIHQYRGEVTFGAWLKKIVVHRSIDFLKSRKQRYVPLDETYMHVAQEEDWTVTDEITVDQVKSAMVQLPEKYKYVVMMYLVEGLDHGEISEILQITQTACRTRLLRGKEQLRELLKQRKHGTGS